MDMYNESLVRSKVEELAKVKGIDRMTLTPKAMEEITEILGLRGLDTEEQLRGTRNAAVKVLGENVREDVDFATSQFWMTRISAITYVIDSLLWDKGFEV